MSVAPLIQLMSRGKQNDILSGDTPQITFWRHRHMRYTDFALEHVQVSNDDPYISSGDLAFDLPRSGDLVHDCFAVFELPGLANTFTLADTQQSRPARYTVTVFDNYKASHFLELNGLIYFITKDTDKLYVYNPDTSEVTQLLQDLVVENDHLFWKGNHKLWLQNYSTDEYFEYDTVTHERTPLPNIQRIYGVFINTDHHVILFKDNNDDLYYVNNNSDHIPLPNANELKITHVTLDNSAKSNTIVGNSIFFEGDLQDGRDVIIELNLDTNEAEVIHLLQGGYYNRIAVIDGQVYFAVNENSSSKIYHRNGEGVDVTLGGENGEVAYLIGYKGKLYMRFEDHQCAYDPVTETIQPFFPDLERFSWPLVKDDKLFFQAETNGQRALFVYDGEEYSKMMEAPDGHGFQSENMLVSSRNSLYCSANANMYRVDERPDVFYLDRGWDAEERRVVLEDVASSTCDKVLSATYELVESAAQRLRYHVAGGSSARTLPGPQPYWCDGVGQAILREVKLRVGSQYVDTLYSDYLYMWDELADKPGRRANAGGYGRMCMKGSPKQRKEWSQTASRVYVPIPLFFMRTSGNALPLVALQFHGVQLVLTCNDPTRYIINSAANQGRDGIDQLFRDNNGAGADPELQDLDGTFRTVVRGGVGTEPMQPATESMLLCTAETQDQFSRPVERRDCHVSLSVGYVYLNVDERTKFADASFEILIDQVQQNVNVEVRAPRARVDLNLNHMVQELVWALKRPDDGTTLRYEPFDYRGERDYVTGVARDAIAGVQLRLNNATRFNMNNGQDVCAEYFRTVEPYLHHTRVPDNHIYSYSFALKPESEQPSGAVNMSRMDSVKLCLAMAEASAANPSYLRKDCPLRHQLAAAQHHSSFTPAGRCQALHLKAYARNWNVFRITLGLGGVKWAS